MANKPKFLKNLLTTASALAVITGGIQTAAAAPVAALRNTVADDAQLIGANLDNGGAAVVANSVVKFNDAGHRNVISDANVGVGYDVNGNANRTITITGVAATILGVTDGGGGGNTAKIIFGTAHDLTLNGTGAAGLGVNANTFKVSEIDFGANNNTVTITNADGLNFEGKIGSSTTDNVGKIVVNSNNVTFSDTIGAAHALDTFKVNDGKTVTLKADSKFHGNVTIGNAGVGGAKLIIENADITAADITSDAANQNTLVLNATGKDITVTSKIGNGNALKSVEFNSAGAGHKVTLTAAARADDFKLDSKVTVDAQNTITGKVTLGNASTLTAANAITGDVTFNDVNSELKLTTANSNVTGDVIANADGHGKIEVSEAVKITGNVGAAGKSLGNINFAVNHALTLDGSAGNAGFYVKTVTTATNNEGKLKFTEGDWTVKSTIGTDGAKLNLVELGDANGLRSITLDSGEIYATDVKFDGTNAHTLTLNNGAQINANVTFANAGNKMIFESGKVTGDVIATNNGDGIIEVKGPAEISGSIGAANAINQIEFTQAGAQLTVAGNGINAANGVVFTKNGTLKLTNTTGDVEVKGGITVNANNTGTIDATAMGATKKLVLEGNIGGVGQNLGLIDLGANANLELKGTSYIEKIKLTGGDDQTVSLSAAGDYLIKNLEHEDNKGVLSVGADVKFIGNVGSDAKSLGKINFAGNHALTLDGSGGATDFYVKTVTTNNNDEGTLKVTAGNWTVKSTIGTNANKLKLVELGDGAGVRSITLDGGEIYATDVKFDNNAAHTLTLNNGAKINANVTFAKDTNKMIFESGKVTGDVIAAANGDGIIAVNGTAEISGNIGAGNAINKIDFTKGGAALTVGGDRINTNAGVVFTNNGTLKLTHTVGDVTVKGGITVNANNTGTIDATAMGATKTLVLEGNIGGVGKNLGLIDLGTNANLELKGDAYIEKINLTGGDDQTVSLSAVGNYLIKNLDHADKKGVLSVGADVKLLENTVVSTEANKLHSVSFAGDHTLTLEKNINLLTAHGITPNTDAHGTLKFSNGGEYYVSGNTYTTNAVGKSLRLKAFHLEDKAIVHYEGELVLAGDLPMGDDSKLYIKSNRVELDNAAKTINSGGKNATVFFKNDAELTAKAKYGDNTTLVFNGKNATLEGIIGANSSIYVDTADAITLTFKGSKADAETFLQIKSGITTNQSDIHNLKLHLTDVNIANVTQQVGAADKRFNDFVLSGKEDSGLKISTPEFHVNHIKSDVNDKHKLEFSFPDLKVHAVGSEGNRFKELKVSENASIKGATYAKKVEVVNTKTLTLGSLFGDKLELSGAASTAVFTVFKGDEEAGVVDVQSAIIATKAGEGVVKFENAASVSLKEMGDGTNALASIESTNVGHYNLAGDVYVKGDINLASNTAEIKHNVKLANTDAPGVKILTLASDTLNLGAHTLTLSKLHFNSPKEIIFAIEGDTNGKLVLAENSEFNLGTKSTLKATVLGMPFSQGADERVITLFEKDTGSSFDVKGNISGEVRESLEQSLNNMLKAEAVYDDNNNFTGRFRLVDNSEQRSREIIAELVAAGSSLAQDTRATESTQALVNKNNFAQARKIADILWELNSQPDTAKAEEALEVVLRVATPITATLEVVENVAANAMQMVSNRVAFVTNMVDVASAAGVAAGDEASAKFGVWASPLYAHGEQKKRSDARPAYSSKSYGGTVGADTMLNDSTTIGAAVTYAKSDIKMKGLKKGDTSSADTMLFTLYANQKLPNDFFIQGMTSYASSNIKNSEKIAGQFDKTKYDSQSFALEVSGGYNYKVMDNVVFTPMIGVSYSKFMDSSLQNSSDIFGRSMTSKSHDTIEAMIGSRVSASFDAGGFTVSPEAHAFVKQNVNGKTRKVTPKVAGLVTELKELSIKPNLTTVNAGLGVTAKAGAMEYTVGYDATMAKKYVGHQGSLKVRVNF